MPIASANHALGGGKAVKPLRLTLSALLLILVACASERITLPRRANVTPLPADGFDFPLDRSRYGPSIPGISGPFNVDTRFGVQNPGLGDVPKCFVDRAGVGVPFHELYHAGEDWFRLNVAGQVDFITAAGDPVRAVARGVVYMTQEIGDQGWVVVIAHRLGDGTPVYSAYWHVSKLQVDPGDLVGRGQVIAMIHNQGGNSHLHWEVRAFADGSKLFPLNSAGGRGMCRGQPVGVAYTWDDDPSRAGPEYWGYHDPVAFVERHRP